MRKNGYLHPRSVLREDAAAADARRSKEGARKRRETEWRNSNIHLPGYQKLDRESPGETRSEECSHRAKPSDGQAIDQHSNVTETRVIQSVVPCTYPVTSLETGTIIDRRFDPTRCPCLSRLSPSLSISCSRGGKDRIMRERE